MSRDAFTLNGAEYDLSHLEPVVVAVTPKAEGAPTYNVLVTFGCHTFTRDLTPDDPEDRLYVEGSEERCFCDVRHAQSLHLPRIIDRTVGGRVFFSEGRNLLCIDWLPDLAAPYAVFFNMTQWKKKQGLHVAMNVVSAYDKPALPDKLPSVTFAMLVAAKATGRTLKVPSEARSIKK